MGWLAGTAPVKLTSQHNLQHGTKLKKWEKEELKSKNKI